MSQNNHASIPYRGVCYHCGMESLCRCVCLHDGVSDLCTRLDQSNTQLNTLLAKLKVENDELDSTSYWREITGLNQKLYQSRLAELATKYGFSFDFYLLSLDEALAFINDLEKAGIAVNGIAGWYGDETSKKSMYYDHDFQTRNSAFSEDVLAKTLYGENIVVESIAETRRILMQQQSPIKFVQIWPYIPYRAWQESLNKKEGQP